MGELIAGIVEIFGAYVLHFLGRVFLKGVTFGKINVEPYHRDNSMPAPVSGLPIVSAKKTMLIGFFILVILVVIFLSGTKVLN